MVNKIFLFVFGSLLLISCDRIGTTSETREAWVPVYTSNTAAIKTISFLPPKQTINPGKIFTVGNFLYQVEQDSGIHVIDYSSPTNPRKIGFIRSFLCKELSVKNGLIYTNNFSDLVVIDASNPVAAREVARTDGVFPDLALQYPQKPNDMGIIYFECPDPKKGIITGWIKKLVLNPKCSR